MKGYFRQITGSILFVGALATNKPLVYQWWVKKPWHKNLQAIESERFAAALQIKSKEVFNK